MQHDLVQSSVRSKLASLKASITVRLALEGAAWVAVVLAASVAVTFGLDYGFRLDDRGVRGIIVAMALAGVLAVIWLLLARPLLVPMLPADLALLVERKFGQLGDRLISAIQLTGRRDLEEMGISRVMVGKMAEEANTLAGPLHFDDVINRRGMMHAWGYALCAVAIIGGFSAWRGDLMDRWFQRNVLFRNTPWPQSTYLHVVGGPDFNVLRGDDLTVTVEVDPNSLVLPQTVMLHADYSSVGRTEERIDHDQDNPRRFTKTFQAVAEEFKFSFTGGDDRRDPAHKVSLIDPPSLKRLTFNVQYPSYMKRPRAETIDGATPVLLVPVGAKVMVEAESTKNLTSAAILLDGRPAGDMQGEKGAGGKPSQRQFIGAFSVEGANKPASMALTFALKDSDGYSNRHGAKYHVQVLPDLQPVLEARKVHVQGKITAQAIVPLNVKVKDDCGVLSVDLMATLQAVPGKDANYSPVAVPAEAGRTYEGTHELDLKLVMPRLQVGQNVYVGARARDTLPKELSGPNVGYSGMIGLLVATDQEVYDEILSRQKQGRLQFIQALGLQNSAMARTGAAKVAFAGGKDDVEGRRLLADSAGSQSSIGTEVSKAAETMSGLLAEMRNNRVSTPDQIQQVRDEVVDPLEKLGDPIQKVSAELNATRDVSDPAELARRSERIEAAQKEIRDRMSAIADRWIKQETKQELANQLQLLIGEQERILKKLEEEKRKEQEAVLKAMSQPATQPAKAGPAGKGDKK